MLVKLLISHRSLVVDEQRYSTCVTILPPYLFTNLWLGQAVLALIQTECHDVQVCEWLSTQLFTRVRHLSTFIKMFASTSFS